MTSRLLPSTIATLLAVPFAVQAAESVSMVASTTQPAVGDSFTISVSVNGSDPYSVLGHCLRYDRTKLRLDSQATGTLGVFVPDSRLLADINTSGEVRTGAYFEAAGPTYPDRPAPSGTIAIYTFTRIASGTTQVSSPPRSGTAPFGWVLIRADATERLPTAPAVVILNDSSPSNDAPTVSAGPNQTITLPSTATLAGTASDDGLPTPASLTYAWTKVSGPGTVTFSATNTLNPTATFSAAGTYVLRLAVSDGALTTNSNVQITVNTASTTNTAPTVSAGPNQAITLPSTATLAGTASDDGLPTPASLTYAWTKVSGPGTVTFSATNTLNPTATFSAAGTYVLRLAVSDGALTANSNVQITVGAANTAPVVNAGSDQNLVLPNTAALSGAVTDDGLPVPASLSYAWTMLSGPGTVTFSAAQALDTTAAFSIAGTYVLQLASSDGARTGTDAVQVLVAAANLAPVVSLTAPTRVVAGKTFTVTTTASDDGLPANAPLSIVRTADGASANWSENSGILMYPTPGTYLVRVSVSDSLLTTTREVQIVVTGANDDLFERSDDSASKCGLGGFAMFGLLGFLTLFRRNPR